MQGSALALNRHELGDEEIKVLVDGNNRVLEISKVCSIQQAVGESVGIEKMTAEYSSALFRELEQMIEGEGLIDIFYERAFERLIPQGHTFTIVDTTAFFSIELDTVEDSILEKGNTFIGSVLYAPSEKWEVYAKGGYETGYIGDWFGGLAFHWYPLKDSKDLRIHATAGYSLEEYVFSIGAIYHLNFPRK